MFSLIVLHFVELSKCGIIILLNIVHTAIKLAAFVLGYLTPKLGDLETKKSEMGRAAFVERILLGYYWTGCPGSSPFSELNNTQHAFCVSDK